MSEPSTSNTPPQPDTTSVTLLPWWHRKRPSLRYKRRARQRMKAAAEHALDVLDKTLKIAGDAAGDAGVPGLSGALSAVRVILQKIQTMRTNIEGVDTLDSNIVSLRDILKDFVTRREGQQISDDTLEQIAELEKMWSEIAQEAGDIKSRGRIKRFFTSNADTKKLASLVQKISTSIHERFILRNILTIKEDVRILRQDVPAIHTGVQKIGDIVGIVRGDVKAVVDGVETVNTNVQEVHEGVDVIRGNVTGIHEGVQEVLSTTGEVHKDVKVVLEGVNALGGGIEEVRDDANMARKDMGEIRQGLEEVRHNVKVILEGSFMTTYAKNAQYNAGGATRRSCLEGTRVNVLDRLLSWITAACTRTREITESVFWISGLAGTGKTTIAVSVAESSAKQNFLAANFFCSRSDAECSNPNLIFPTLSRQLCHFHAPFREKVAEILKRNPDIIHADPLLQIEELIVKPLEAVRDTFPTSVIVLDALDECVDKNATSTILTAIAKFIHRIAGLVLFVVTSRPEQRITAFFDKAAEGTLKDVTTPLLLHKIELDSVLDDIGRFLEDGFARLPLLFTVEEGWPAAQDVKKLVKMSGGLFIWAATALLFIMDQAFCDPQGQLESLLAMAPTSRPQETILDALYNQIANAALSNIAPTLSHRLRSILGALAVAQEPLSVETLSSLLELRESVVRNALIRLSSVLHIPDRENPAETIHTIHLTFPEFLLTSSPTKPQAFHISAPDHHLAMFTRCMVIMRGLKRNIAGIKSPSTFKSEIHGLDKTIEKYIPPLLAYACRYWWNHLAQCVGSTSADSSYDIFHEFLYHHYLHWLEACNLLGYVEEAVNGHRMVLQTCKTLGGRFADLTPLLVDCQRFALTYAACVGAAPLQLYHSALAVAPTNSLVRNAYAQDLGASLIVCRGARSEWTPCLGAFMGHESNDRRVFAVAFSPHGDCFVTGGWDPKLRIWRPTTRTMMLAFGGHTGRVACLAFSPDGAYIASGSGDHDVRVWKVSTGQCVQTLSHKSAVGSVAYSRNGQRILSIADAGEVKLWDSSNGNCVHALRIGDRQIYPRQAGISPDGDVIAYGEGNSLYLYNVSPATSEALEFPERVDGATISPDGRFVAGHSLSIIQVWQLADRSLVRSIDTSNHRGVCGRLVFSPDGTHIGYGSYNGSVYLWQVLSKAPPRVLRGHIDCVCDLSWSPDGLWVVSVSSDKTIRVWDITQPSTDVVSQHHPTATGPVRFVLVRYKGGADLLHLPSATADIARIAALALALPEGAPTLMPFADIVDAWDARLQIVDDMTAAARAYAWAAVAGQRVNIAQGEWVQSRVSVSRDCSLMACRPPNSYSTVDIYDLQTGAIITSLAEITDGLWFTVFSPDGSLIVTCSLHGSVQMWNPATGVRLHSYKHNFSIRALAFSADGHLMVLGCNDQAARVLEAATGQVVRVLKSHRHMVMEVAFAAGNTHILTLDEFHWFHIWDMETGTCVYEISLNDNSWIHGLNFSQDGTGILVAGDDHHEARTLSLWEPGSRSWPVYLVSREGWLYAKGPGRTARLCWLPLEWRNVFSLGGGRLCAPDYSQKRAVVLDVSQLPDYVGFGPE